MTIKLQGIYNQQAAKAAKELKTGDVIVWNYGYTSTVVDLIPSKTGKTITCMLKSNQDGVIRERKMGAERQIRHDWSLLPVQRQRFCEAHCSQILCNIHYEQ